MDENRLEKQEQLVKKRKLEVVEKQESLEKEERKLQQPFPGRSAPGANGVARPVYSTAWLSFLEDHLPS